MMMMMTTMMMMMTTLIWWMGMETTIDEEKYCGELLPRVSSWMLMMKSEEDD